jgi:chromosome segregation ATPase
MLDCRTSCARSVRRILVQGILCAAVLWTLQPCCFAQYRSALRMIRSRARQSQTEQRRETISALQSQLRAAQQELREAQSQLTAAQSEVQLARSQLDSAKKREAEQAKALQEASHALKALEDKIIASQSPETPLGRALNFQSETEQQLIAELKRALGKNASIGDQESFDFSKEYLKLTPAQRDQLKQDASFQSTQRRFDGAKYDVEHFKKQLFEVHPAWKSAQQSVRSAGEELKEAQAARKSAASDLAVAMRNLTRIRASAAMAQSAVNQLSTQLSSMGVRSN